MIHYFMLTLSLCIISFTLYPMEMVPDQSKVKIASIATLSELEFKAKYEKLIRTTDVVPALCPTNPEDAQILKDAFIEATILFTNPATQTGNYETILKALKVIRTKLFKQLSEAYGSNATLIQELGNYAGDFKELHAYTLQNPLPLELLGPTSENQSLEYRLDVLNARATKLDIDLNLLSNLLLLSMNNIQKHIEQALEDLRQENAQEEAKHNLTTTIVAIRDIATQQSFTEREKDIRQLRIAQSIARLAAASQYLLILSQNAETHYLRIELANQRTEAQNDRQHITRIHKLNKLLSWSLASSVILTIGLFYYFNKCDTHIMEVMQAIKNLTERLGGLSFRTLPLSPRVIGIIAGLPVGNRVVENRIGHLLNY